MLPYKKTHDEQMYAVIAKSEDALVKSDVESTLGNFFVMRLFMKQKKYLEKILPCWMWPFLIKEVYGIHYLKETLL